jgi:hypothetical protein
MGPTSRSSRTDASRWSERRAGRGRRARTSPSSDTCRGAGWTGPSAETGRRAPNFKGEEDWARGVAIQANGKIVVGGFAYRKDVADFALARYRVSGRLNRSFGSLGLRRTDFGAGKGDYAFDLGLQADERICRGVGDCFSGLRRRGSEESRGLTASGRYLRLADGESIDSDCLAGRDHADGNAPYADRREGSDADEHLISR